MLSRKYKCIFVHIPKVAGQSIEHVFLSLHGLTWKARAPLLLRANSDPDLGPPRLAHLKASEYVSCGYMTDDEYQSFFSFSFVRNPWNRLVSVYNYLGYPEVMSFSEFVRKDFDVEERWESALFTKPQYDYLFNDRGDQLVDFIGRFESLQADFDHVCEAVGIPRAKLPHVNRTGYGARGYSKFRGGIKKLSPFHKIYDKHGHYTGYYHDDDIKYVAKMYEKDIDVFGYKYGE